MFNGTFILSNILASQIYNWLEDCYLEYVIFAEKYIKSLS